MGNVRLDRLNNKQRFNLANKNKKWKKEGLVPNDKIFYSHCNRCKEFNLGVRFKPISEFSLHGSTSDGCSTYCTNCVKTRLTKDQISCALDLMEKFGVAAEDGVVMLRNEEGVWVKATSLDYPQQVLESTLLSDCMMPVPATKSNYSKSIIGLISISLMLGVLWVFN